MNEKKRYINITLSDDIIETLKSIVLNKNSNGFNSKRKNFYLSIKKNNVKKLEQTKEDVIDIFKNIGINTKEIKERIIFYSSYDFIDIIKKIIKEKKIENMKSYQHYITKSNLAKKLIIMADFKTNNELTLEPSAGQGGIASHIPSKNIHCVEYSKTNADILEKKGFIVFHDDFINFSHKTHYRYDRIIMSPPFLGGKGIQHVINAYHLLKTNGVILAVLPESMKNKIIIKNEVHEYSDILDGGFENTNIKFVILKIIKKS